MITMGRGIFDLTAVSHDPGRRAAHVPHQMPGYDAERVMPGQSGDGPRQPLGHVEPRDFLDGERSKANCLGRIEQHGRQQDSASQAQKPAQEARNRAADKN
jgi:hypothetical protein